MNPKESLSTAATVIDQRGARYGGIEDNFGRAAQIASITTGKPISARDVIKVLIAVKQAREIADPQNEDHYLDVINYAAFLHQMTLNGS